MAFAASLAELQAETSCPICLDYLRDPVTTDCGHNFCRSCIHQCWEDLQDVFPCPVCLHHCPDKTLQRNAQLCHMTDFVKQLPTPRRSKRKRQKEEPLLLRRAGSRRRSQHRPLQREGKVSRSSSHTVLEIAPWLSWWAPEPHKGESWRDLTEPFCGSVSLSAKIGLKCLGRIPKV
uniref:RING-type domain-containing protein n=1 Tax=Prolemur simus TaxID=1328070 RepID=A0A8C8ZV50_PROSS